MENKVYFITDGKYVKIGFTMRDINSRLSQLQTGNPNKLNILFSIEASQEFEKFLHDYFDNYRILNEWFDIVVNQDEITELRNSFEYYNRDDRNGFKVYINYNDPANKIKSAKDYVIMFKLCELMKYNKNTFTLSKELIEDITSTLDINKYRLIKGIQVLIELKIVYKNKAEYLINPFMFWKGSCESRRRLINKESTKQMFESI